MVITGTQLNCFQYAGVEGCFCKIILTWRYNLKKILNVKVIILIISTLKKEYINVPGKQVFLDLVGTGDPKD